MHFGTREKIVQRPKTARAAANATLRGDLRALTPNDARWASFGLNAPGAAVTPAAPA